MSSTGAFILNFVCRDDLLKESVLADLRTQFPSIYTLPIEDDVNEILVLLPEKTADSVKTQRRQFRERGKTIQKQGRSATSRWDFDLAELLGELKIQDE